MVADAGIDVTKFVTGKNWQTGDRQCCRSVKRSSFGISMPAHSILQDLVEKKNWFKIRQICRPLDIVPRQYDQLTYDGEKLKTIRQ